MLEMLGNLQAWWDCQMMMMMNGQMCQMCEMCSMMMPA